MQLRDWTDRDGNKRRSAEVVVDNVYFGESKRESSGSEYGGPPPYGAPARPSGPAASGGSAPDGDSEFSEIGEEDGELPF